VLKREIEKLFFKGCPCHLINLAAEKGAACLPVKVDEYLLDIFLCLEKSAKRKDMLKQFQQLTEMRKILKRVCTRWLSPGRCLARLLQEWEPLTSQFKSEVKCEKEFNVGSLQSYKIPKLKDKSIESGADIENSLHSAAEMKTLSSGKRNLDSKIPSSSRPKKLKPTDNSRQVILLREERSFISLI
jgi:hypothetical protein